MIRLGPAGNCDKDILSSLRRLPILGLSAQEIEFTHGVTMSNAKAAEAGELAKELDIQLTIHAPYFLNLLSEDNLKRLATVQRILQSCERGHHLGAKYVVFHPAFYGKHSKEDAYQQVKYAVQSISDTLKANAWYTKLAAETTGKQSQFGELDELLRLRKDTGCDVCIDFAHLLARHGKVDYNEVFRKLEGIDHIHSHYSGIVYGEKGERKHVVIDEKEFVPLAEVIAERKPDITMICESPDTWMDAVKMKNILDRITSKNI